MGSRDAAAEQIPHATTSHSVSLGSGWVLQGGGSSARHECLVQGELMKTLARLTAVGMTSILCVMAQVEALFSAENAKAHRTEGVATVNTDGAGREFAIDWGGVGMDWDGGVDHGRDGVGMRLG